MRTARQVVEEMLLDHRGPGTTLTGIFSDEQEAALRELLDEGTATLRDEFAGFALMGLCASRQEDKYLAIAFDAYRIADAMLTERKDRSRYVCGVPQAVPVAGNGGVPPERVPV